MTEDSKKSPSNVRGFRRRSPGGAVGALLGAAAMSVIGGVLLTAAVTPVVALTAAATSTTISIFENLPDHINPGKLSQPSTIWAKRGDEEVLLARFYAQNRQMVGWDDISQHVKDAAVSEEDPRFYTHGGIDVLAAGRAVLQNVTGSGRSGASTITMQYVRNVLIQEAEMIPNEKEREKAYNDAIRQDLDRKLKEMRLAISVEKSYSKNDILLGYLNIANYGGQIYGIESAAKAYYSKSAKDLSIAEAASLVSIVNLPSELHLANPDNIAANQERRDKIIGSMLREGKITQAEHDEAIATPVEPHLSETPTGCTIADQHYGLGHLCDYATKYLQQDKLFGATPEERWFNFQNGGLKIVTTADLDLQQAAFESTRAHAPAQHPGIDYGTAAVTIENRTGRVLAMIQNRPFSDDPNVTENNKDYTAINYSTDNEYGGSSGFQYGSVMKSFTLAEWVRAGHSVNEVVDYSPGTVSESSFTGSCFPDGVYGYGSFTFKNWNGARGRGTVLYSTDQSLNGGYVSMAKKLDLCNIFKLAEDMGLKRATENAAGNRKLAVVPSGVYNGNDEVSPLTLASAMAGFSSEGTVCTPVPIDSITDSEGKNVEFTKSKCKEAIQPDVANSVAYALQHNVTSGLSSSGRSRIGVPHMAKTGTTDDSVDEWWAGGSTKVTTVSWNGNVNGKVDLYSVGRSGAGRLIWIAMMNAADEKYGGDAFPTPNPNALQNNQQTVPDVSGRSVTEATQILTAAGFQVRTGEEVDSTQPKGSVAGTDPGAGSPASSGDTVTLKISNGNAPASDDDDGVPLPDGLVGSTAQNAANTLGAAGFNSIFMRCETGASPNASMQVVDVDPKPGSRAKPTDRITLKLKC